VTWNYRIFRKTYDSGEHEYSIREAYYHRKNSKNPHSWAAGPIAPVGTELLDLKADMKYMRMALSKPVLDDQTGKPVKKD